MIQKEDSALERQKAHLTRKQQLLWGGLMMLTWLAIGTPIMMSVVDDEPFFVLLLAGTSGFFIVLLNHEPGDEVVDFLFSTVPDTWHDQLEITLLLSLGAMWVLVFLLPLFGNWRSRTRLLFTLQNSYAAIQALAYPILDKYL